jgi:hypothetical protein
LSAPLLEARVLERRRYLRFDKVFTVYLATSEGMSRAVCRNISVRGLFIETREPVPLLGRLRVTFSGEDGTEMTCLCEVRYQVALSYGHKGGTASTRGMGLRVLAYENRDERPLVLQDRERVFH